MGLLIHDLNGEEWEKVKGEYEGWRVVSDNGAMHPCIGCFSCWNRTPGACVIKDGYEDMGALIHHADEVVVISRYTYGGFSGSVKNILDRSIGYILPQFEVVEGETHHMRRYDEDKPFTFIFYGRGLSAAEKEAAERYVKAVCANMRGHVKTVKFRESAAEGQVESAAGGQVVNATCGTAENPTGGGTLLLNMSMRVPGGNSAKLASELCGRLGSDAETADLKDYMEDMPALIDRICGASKLVICTPLYVDGLPSQAVRLMEKLEAENPCSLKGSDCQKKVYLLANMGMYESEQLGNLFAMVRAWCEKAGLEYCGGLGVSTGEVIGAIMKKMPFGTGATKTAAEGMEQLARAVNEGLGISDIYAGPYELPRDGFIEKANASWDRAAVKNGITPEDLYRRL